MLGTDLLKAALGAAWRGLCVVVLLVLVASRTLAADPVVDVEQVSSSVDLAGARGEIVAPSPNLEVDVAGPNGQPVAMNLDSKGRGPKYFWTLYAFTNSAQDARTMMLEQPRTTFTGSQAPLLAPPASGNSPIINATTSQGPARLVRTQGAQGINFKFVLSPGERLTVALESNSPGLVTALWSEAALAGHEQRRTYFAGALLGIMFVVSFACLALYGWSGHSVTRVGAAFSFASLMFLVHDMGLSSGIFQFLPPQVEPRHISALVEALMASSLTALLWRFHDRSANRFLTRSLAGLTLLSFVNIFASIIFPEHVSTISRAAFVVISALGLPLLLRARTRGVESFAGVVLVWCFILAWAAYAVVVAFAAPGGSLLAPLFWAGLVATTTTLGMFLFKHALAIEAQGSMIVPENTEALAVHAAGHAIWDWYPGANRMLVGPQMNEKLGYGAVDSALSTQQFVELMHPDDQLIFKTLIAESVSGVSPFLYALLRLRAADMSYRPFLLRAQMMSEDGGRLNRCIGTLTEQHIEYPVVADHFEQTHYPSLPPPAPPPQHIEVLPLPPAANTNTMPAAEAKLPERPPTPPPAPSPAPPSALSSAVAGGVAERGIFMDRLEDRLAQPGQQLYRVLLVGIDRFKVLNEGLGHAAGDRLLELVAQRLLAGLSSGDMLCRMSGSQFAIYVAEDQGGTRGPDMARTVTVNLGKAIVIDGRDLAVTASIGLSSAGRTPYTAEDLLAQATSALLVAKSRGVAQTAAYEVGMRDDRPVKFSLEQDLRRALERKEIEVQYQPITRLDTFELAGFEALARWNHPERGVVSPADFIGLAEQTGAIAEIGRYVLGEAARQLGVWQRTLARGRQMFVAVNVSAMQLLDETFLVEVERLLTRESIALGTLKLEVTESVVIKYPERLKLLFAHLKSRGVSLACDDFGTGFSSLSLLRELPFDTLKVDKSFLSPRGMDERSRHVLETILELAHGLNMTVVTEGIESEDMANDMSMLGFDYGQGYYFGAAGPAGEVEDLLSVLPKMVETEGLPPMHPLEPYDMPQQLPSIYTVETAPAEVPDISDRKLKTVTRRKASSVPDVT